MKRIVCLFLLILSFITYYFYPRDVFYNHFSSIGSAKFCYVYENGQENCVMTGAKVVRNGNSDMVYFEASKPSASGAKYRQAKLLLADFNESEMVREFRAKMVSDENVDGFYVKYLYSPIFREFCMVNGRKINVQIAFVGEEVVVGVPMIFSGF